jgi:osmotically inducible lipoprotein OsmB
MTMHTPLLLDDQRTRECAPLHTGACAHTLEPTRTTHATAGAARQASPLRRLAPAAVVAAAIALSGCASNPSRQDMGTVAGAVVGGVTGSVLTGGSTFGTVGGAVAGGYVGRELSKDGKRR